MVVDVEDVVVDVGTIVVVVVDPPAILLNIFYNRLILSILIYYIY